MNLSLYMRMLDTGCWFVSWKMVFKLLTGPFS